MPGKAIIRASWASNVVFALSAIPFAAGADDLEALAIVMALVLFAISLGVWVWAFVVAVARSAGGENIMVGNLFLLEGKVEQGVRWHLFGLCLVITAFTASANPFGVLVPMLPVGFIGLWGACHGTYGPRPGFEPEVRPLRPNGNTPSEQAGTKCHRSGGRNGHDG